MTSTLSETTYTLQIKWDNKGAWATTIAGMFEESRRLANRGNVVEALELAASVHRENYGCDASRFRVVKTEQTVTTLGGKSDLELPT